MPIALAEKHHTQSSIPTQNNSNMLSKLTLTKGQMLDVDCAANWYGSKRRWWSVQRAKCAVMVAHCRQMGWDHHVNPYEYHPERGLYYHEVSRNLICGSQPQTPEDIEHLHRGSNSVIPTLYLLSAGA
jgi:hypothetical protein